MTLIFQSTLPVRGATASSPMRRAARSRFQSTLPVRGATGGYQIIRRTQKFQSTLPVRGATDTGLVDLFGTIIISIHAPRAGSDEAPAIEASKTYISIHAPRAGSDLI